MRPATKPSASASATPNAPNVLVMVPPSCRSLGLHVREHFLRALVGPGGDFVPDLLRRTARAIDFDGDRRALLGDGPRLRARDDGRLRTVDVIDVGRVDVLIR